jgi:TonB-dependent receptor
MGKSIRRALLGASSIVAVAAFCGAAYADDQSTDKKANTVSEVVVTGIRGSLQDSIKQKRASPLIVETISSKDIGQLPDVTIAEELDRLPGINATRDRGNDSQAAVRGLGPRLVLGLVNGREVASSEPDRNVRWEIYPSETVSGVTVYKSQSADLIAGGVAATIDIRTLRPLDYSGPALVLRAGPVYYDGGQGLPGYSPWGYRASGEYVTHLTDQLAWALGASYQNQKNGYDSFQGWGYNDANTGGNPPTINGQTLATPWGAQTEVDKLTETRGAVTSSLQWRPSTDFQLNFDVLYSDVKIDENQDQQWYSRNGVWGDWGGSSNWAYTDPMASYTVVNGTVVAATLPWASVTNVIAHYSEDKSLLATGVNGIWTVGDWKLVGDLSFSEAQRTNTWQAVETEVYPHWMSFDWRAGHVPSVTASINPADPTNQPLASWLPGQSSGPQHLQDDLAAARFDVTRALHGRFFTGFDAGVRYSSRIKGLDQTAFTEAPIIGALPASMLSYFTVKGFTVPPILDGNFDQLAKAAYGGFGPAGPLSPAWRVHEGDFEGYVKTDFAHEVGGVPMTGNAGVRVVSVDVSSTGGQSINGGPVTPITLTHNYTDVLPSLSLNFNLTDDTLLRFGAARVVARPPLDEMRAGRTLWNTSPPPTGSGGNPSLNPFRANQVDLSWEWYFHREALFAVAAYYKDVESNIGYKTDLVNILGINYLVTGPFNGKGGTMDGVEFTFQTPFYFVPGLDHFGIYSNLALGNSTIKEFSPANNPLPQVGYARTTAEIDLWYSNHGFESRLGYKYHSPFTVIYGWDASQLTRLESEGILDFSASYQVNSHMGVRFQANNLTNQVARMYWDNDPNRLARYDIYGRRMLLDFTFKY